jgi:hypothetical protein
MQLDRSHSIEEWIMPTLAIDIPEQMLDQLAMEPGEFVVTMKTMTALKMYELGQLSSYAAAALAGVSRGEFLQRLRTYQIPPFVRVDATGAPTPPCTTCPMQKSYGSPPC